MKELIKKLAGKIYSYLGGDLCELTRRANNLLTPGTINVDPESDRMSFLRAMATLHDSKELEWLHCQISEEQKKLSFENARSELELNWGRATQNGIMLVRERLKGYKSEFQEALKRDEVFDPYKAI